MRIKLILAYFIFSFCFGQNEIQKKPSPIKSIPSNFISPVTKAYPILLFGVLSTGLTHKAHNQYSYEKSESFSDAQPLGEFGVVGEYLGWGFLNAGYVASNYLLGEFNDNDRRLRQARLLGEASLYTLLWTVTLKASIKEKRPGYPDQDDSFPSGHAALSFSFASYVAAQHGWKWGSAAYLAATFISVSRVNDDWHYLHDLLAGATIGNAYGWGVFWNNETDEEKLSFSPSFYNDALLLNVTGRF